MISQKLLISSFLFLNILSYVYSENSMRQDEFLLRAGSYEVTISTKYAFTMTSISFNKNMIGIKNGFYGTVFCPSPGKYIGAGHTEGGEEKVKSIKLMVNGKEEAIEAGKIFEGQKITIEKVSNLDKLELTEIVEISPEDILIKRTYIATENQPAYSLYTYQFPWSADTKEWIAELPDGAIEKGGFRDDDGWVLSKDVKWTGIYHPIYQTGILLYYPEIIPGQQRKSCYWDKKGIYHKYYLMTKIPDFIPKGGKLGPYTGIIKAFNAPTEEWEKQAVKIAEELKKRVDNQNIESNIIQKPQLEGGLVEKKSHIPNYIEWKGQKYIPAVYFDLTNLTELTIRDAISNIPATIKGTFISDAEGLHFDGKTTHIVIDNKEKINELLIGSFIISFQINTAAYESTYSSYLFTQRINKPDIGISFGLGGEKNNPGRLFVTYGSGQKGAIVGSKEKPVPLNKWVEVKFHYDSEKKVGELYCEDELLGKQLVDLPTIECKENPIYLGAWGSTNIYYFTGIIKKVSIYIPEQQEKKKDQITMSSENSSEEWLINRRGVEALDENFVPPPFIPVETQREGIVQLWGRRYFLNKFGFIKQVEINSHPFFDRGMDFDLVINGSPWLKDAVLTMKKDCKGKAVFASLSNSENVKIEVITSIEYDGMVKIDFSIIPEKPITIDKFQYRIYYPADKAIFLRYDGARMPFESTNIPKNSYSMAIPSNSGIVWKAPFKTLVWIGDFEKGFLWFCSSEQYWNPQERAARPDALQIIRKGEEVILQISPVSLPYKVEQSVKYTFGFFATPVRPLPKYWRSWTQSYSTTDDNWAFSSQSKLSKILYHPQNQWAEAPFYPKIKNLEELTKYVEKKRQEGKEVIPYIDARLMTIGILKDAGNVITGKWEIPDFELVNVNLDNDDSIFKWKVPEVKYYKQWRIEPPITMGYEKEKGYIQFLVSSKSGWADLLCYFIEQLAKAGIRGIANLDEWYYEPDMNALHGSGYIDQNGIRRFDYDIFEKRDLMKRIYYIFLKTTDKEPIIIAHTSASLCLPFTSHFNVLLSGEHFNSSYYTGKNFLDEYFKNSDALYQCLKEGGKNWYYYVAPLERWAAELIGKQFGFAVMLIGQMTKDKNINKEIANSKEASRELLTLVALHDNLSWPIFCAPEPFYNYWKIREDFGIADEEVEFYPYWKGEGPFLSKDKEILISSYLNKGRYLSIIGNISLEKITTEIIPKPFIKKVKNAETGEDIQLLENKVRLSIPPRDCMIVVAE